MIPFLGRRSQRELKDYIEYSEIGLAQGPKRIIEPFANLGLFSTACALKGFKGQIDLYFLEEDYGILLENIINRPDYMARAYEDLWSSQLKRGKEDSFDQISLSYERTKDSEVRIMYLSLLIERTSKLLGKKPSQIKSTYLELSYYLKGKTLIEKGEYFYKDGTRSDLYFISFMESKKDIIKEMIADPASKIILLDKKIKDRDYIDIVRVLKEAKKKYKQEKDIIYVYGG